MSWTERRITSKCGIAYGKHRLGRATAEQVAEGRKGRVQPAMKWDSEEERMMKQNNLTHEDTVNR